MALAQAELIRTGPTVADQLVEAGQSMAHSQHRVVVLAARFEESDEWWCSLAGTAAHWIAAQLDVCVSTAREWIRIGKALRTLPAVDAAFRSRQLSYAKVRALTRVAQPESEDELVDLARSVPAGRLGHALAAWTQRHEDHDQRTARHERDRSLRHRVEADGMATFTLRLAPEDATAVLAAVEATVMRRSQQAKSQNVAGSAAERDDHASADASDSLAQPAPVGAPEAGHQGTRSLLHRLRRHRAARIRPRPQLRRDRPHHRRGGAAPLRPLPSPKARSARIAKSTLPPWPRTWSTTSG